MMSLLSSMISFAAVAGLLTVLPGLDTAMVLRSAAVDGRRHGFVTALGICGGMLVWGTAVAVGVAALLQASSAAYNVVRIAGACYMLWLGLRLLLRAWREPPDTLRSPVTSAAHRTGLLRSWRRGLATNLLNPKIGAFYVAVLPQFIPAHSSHLAVGLLLAGVHVVESMLWFSVLVLGAHSVRQLLARRAARRGIDGVTAATLIGFGVGLGLSGR